MRSHVLGHFLEIRTKGNRRSKSKHLGPPGAAFLRHELRWKPAENLDKEEKDTMSCLTGAA